MFSVKSLFAGAMIALSASGVMADHYVSDLLATTLHIPPTVV
jgi:hypothetical protein